MTKEELKSVIKSSIQFRANKYPELYIQGNVCLCCKDYYKDLTQHFSDKVWEKYQEDIKINNYDVLISGISEIIKNYEKKIKQLNLTSDKCFSSQQMTTDQFLKELNND